jgi:hypothetical protein
MSYLFYDRNRSGVVIPDDKTRVSAVWAIISLIGVFTIKAMMPQTGRSNLQPGMGLNFGFTAFPGYGATRMVKPH